MKGYLFLISFFILMLISCNMIRDNNKNNSVDPFYTDKGGLDRPRIPLIKPYELLKVGNSEWRMKLLTTDVSISIHNIKGVNVSEDKILIYSEGGTDIRFKNYTNAWFFIDALNTKEKYFLNYKAYTDSLQRFNVSDTSLFLPDRIYKDFSEKGIVKWE